MPIWHPHGSGGNWRPVHERPPIQTVPALRCTFRRDLPSDVRSETISFRSDYPTRGARRSGQADLTTWIGRCFGAVRSIDARRDRREWLPIRTGRSRAGAYQPSLSPSACSKSSSTTITYGAKFLIGNSLIATIETSFVTCWIVQADPLNGPRAAGRQRASFRTYCRIIEKTMSADFSFQTAV
jgi:hypothetical protein